MTAANRYQAGAKWLSLFGDIVVGNNFLAVGQFQFPVGYRGVQ